MEAEATKGSVETVAPEIHLTAKDWAQRSGLPYRTILAAIKAGDLVAYRVAATARGCLYISAEDFRAWLNSCRVQPAVPVNPNRRDYYKNAPVSQSTDSRMERIKRAKARARS